MPTVAALNLGLVLDRLALPSTRTKSSGPVVYQCQPTVVLEQALRSCLPALETAPNTWHQIHWMMALAPLPCYLLEAAREEELEAALEG